VFQVNTVGINAKLGDGCLYTRSETNNVHAIFNGKNVQWITFKRDLAKKNGFKTSPIRPSYSGYKNDWSLVQFYTNRSIELTEVYYTERVDVLQQLSKMDLILWYIDDGSWHKTRGTMHLYCNALNESELNVLADRIEHLYGVRPTLTQDRKKDGRSYPYFYFPKALVHKFRRDVRRFLKWLELDSLYYKVGETSETIR
jgi:hypothetical protein